MPVAFFGFLWVTSRGDMQAALSTPAGIAAVAVGAAMEGAAFLWIRKLLEVGDGGHRGAVLARSGRGAVAVRAARRVRGCVAAHRDGRSCAGPPGLPAPPGRLGTSRSRRVARSSARRDRAEAGGVESIDAEVPQLLDLLAAGSTADSPPSSPSRRSVEVLRAATRPRLRALFGAVDLGARWRTELARPRRRVAVAATCGGP